MMTTELASCVLDSVDAGAVAVIVEMNGRYTIFQFEKHEFDDAARTFRPYFELMQDNRWESVFRAAFDVPLLRNHVATILVTSTNVEQGVVFPSSEAN